MVRNIFGCEQYAVNEMHKVHSFNKFSKFVLRTYSVPESIKSDLTLTALTHFTVKTDVYTVSFNVPQKCGKNGPTMGHVSVTEERVST